MRRRGRLALGILLMASALACAKPQPSVQSVVLVVLDAAGARYFGCYGNALPATPRIDAFARDATVFERAYAQAAWTLPSVGSLMTGLYPNLDDDVRLAEQETLAGVLQREGLATAAFSENPYVTRDFGMEAGFEDFREYFPYGTIDRSPHRFGRRNSQRTVDHALDWLRERRGERFFLYLHLLPPHAPYDAPPPFGGRFARDYAGSVHGFPHVLADANDGKLALAPRDVEHLRLQYQENLAYADHQVGRLLDGLVELGIFDRALVIVTSDHGEAFREHGVLMHNTTVYEEMIHVPLVMRLPDASLPARFGGVVELRSLFATVCEALALASCPAGPASSLLVHVRGERPGLARSWAREGEEELLALILPRDKLIVRAPAFEPLALFDLVRDPDESVDLRAEAPERVARALRQLRDDRLDPYAVGEGGVEPATRERLEALGYAEPGPSARP